MQGELTEENVHQMEDALGDGESTLPDTDGESNLVISDTDSTISRDTVNDRLTATEKDLIIQYVHDLKCKEKRAKALQELSKNREHFSDLAPLIWHSIGTISAL